MNVYLTMETSLSFGYCSVASNLGQYKEFEETFQLYKGGGSQSVLILEKQSATAYPRKCSATRPAGCEAHLTCGNCPMHCATVAYPKKSSIFDIFWDQINGKNCSVQQHVCQPEGLYSLGNFNVYMYVWIILIENFVPLQRTCFTVPYNLFLPICCFTSSWEYFLLILRPHGWWWRAAKF